MIQKDEDCALPNEEKARVLLDAFSEVKEMLTSKYGGQIEVRFRNIDPRLGPVDLKMSLIHS